MCTQKRFCVYGSYGPEKDRHIHLVRYTDESEYWANLGKTSFDKSVNYCAFIIYKCKSGLTAATLAAILVTVHQMSIIVRKSVFRVCVFRGMNLFQHYFRPCQEGQVFILLSHLNLSTPIIAERSGLVGTDVTHGVATNCDFCVVDEFKPFLTF